MKRFLLLIIGWITVGSTAHGQPNAVAVDSLRTLLTAQQPDTNRVKMLLELGRAYILKPGEQKVDLDTAILVTQQAFRLSHRLDYGRGQGLSYLMAGQAQREKDNRKLGKLLTQQAIGILAKWGTEDDRADAYMELANFYTLSDNDLAEKIKLYELAIPLLAQTHDRKKLADALMYRGDLFHLQNKYAPSLKDLKQALAVYQSIHYTRLHGVYDLIGYVSSLAGNAGEGLRYGLEALKVAQQLRDSSMFIPIYNRLGITYEHLSDWEAARRLYEQSLAVAQQLRDNNSIVTVTLNLVSIYKALHQDGKSLAILEQLVHKHPITDPMLYITVTYLSLRLYTKLRKFTLAEKACDRLLQLTKTLDPNDLMFGNIYNAEFNYYLATQQHARGRAILVENQAFCKRIGNTGMLAINYLLWFKLDSTTANYASAIKHFQQHKRLQESVLNETKSKQVNELEVRYNTYEKQQRIQLLTQKSALQQSQLAAEQHQLQAAQTIRNFSIATALMLILLLGLGYNRYHLRQKSNQLLQIKQREINQKNDSLQQVLGEKEELLAQKEWMLKEIHHRVKNNLQIVAGLLYSQSVYLKDKVAQSAVRESQNRVQAMALLHQKLYQSDRLASVLMAEYIREIVDHLINSFDQLSPVKTQVDVAPVELDVTLAVPLGLIINEAVTNSLKYGFPTDEPGLITIQLEPEGAMQYVLRIHDDGVGLPADFDPKRSRSLGMSLIRGLSKQIGADLQITSEHGVTVNLRFSHDALTRNST